MGLPDIETIAGTGVPGYSGNGGPATMAELRDPAAVACTQQSIPSPSGSLDGPNVVIADRGNHCVRAITSSGEIVTIAGTPERQGFGGDGGAAVGALLDSPSGIAIGQDGTIFVSDTGNHCIRMIKQSDGSINTIAGIPTQPGFSGDGGSATQAQLNFPLGVACVTLQSSVPDGFAMGLRGIGVTGLLICDSFNSCVRMVEWRFVREGVKPLWQQVTPPTISTVAGLPGTAKYSGDGGLATKAGMGFPHGILVLGDLPLSEEMVFVGDAIYSVLRQFKLGGDISTVAGMYPPSAAFISGITEPLDAGLLSPGGLALDPSGAIYIVEVGGADVLKLDLVQGVSVVAGNGTFGFSGDGQSPLSASLSFPTSIAIDSGGYAYVTDSANNRVRGWQS